MNLLVKACLRKRPYTEAEARPLVRLSHRQRGDEGAEALRLHQTRGRAERERREAALQQAIKAAREQGEIPDSPGFSGKISTY